MFISTSPSIIPSNRFDMLDPTDHNQLFNNTQFSIHEFEEQQDFESQQQQQPPQQQQQQQSPPVAQYGQPYYPQTDSYNSLMGQTPQYPQPTFGQSQHFYQNAYNQPVQPQYQPAYQPPQQYNQYQQQPQEQQQQQQFNPNMPNAQTQQQVDPSQLEHLQRLLLQHLQNNQNQYQHPPQ